MHRFTTIFLIFVSASLIISSCKDDEPDSTNTSNPSYEFDIPTLFSDNYSIPEDNPTTTLGVALGRQLFYEKLLSADSSMSCGTCHLQEFAFSDGGKTFSLGVTNEIGNMHTMTIVNPLWQNQFFWDGRTSSLEEQALKPIANPIEMNLSIETAIERLQNSETYPSLFKNAFGSDIIDSTNLAKAIAQFERTLISGNSKYDKYKAGLVDFTDAEIKGEELFFTHPEAETGLRGGNCGDCHSGFLTQANTFSNNGLDTSPDDGLYAVTESNADKGKFKIPTLRNIEVSSPYMHDGRFTTLEEVLDHYNEHIKYSPTLDPLIIEASNDIGSGSLGLTTQEKEYIIAFLKTLTDDEFLTNSDFSDPFDE